MAKPTEKPESLEELRARLAAQGEEERARIEEAGKELDAYAAAKLKAAEDAKAAQAAATRTQQGASFDALHKGDAKAAFLRTGGDPADFEEHWLTLRPQIVQDEVRAATRQRAQWQRQAARRYR